jgi:acetyl esterase/lipase
LLTFPTLQNISYGQGHPILKNGIIFGRIDGVELKLDLARPAEGKGPFPALVFIHGGGWFQDTRAEFDYTIQQAAEKGYVAVTVDYRLTKDELPNGQPKYPFPAQVYDVKAAVRWLRENAKTYGIDPNRIGAVGSSAGAYLALMLGLTNPSDGFEGDGTKTDYASNVQAVVSVMGPTELSSSPAADSYILGRLLGGTAQQVPEKYRIASPILYVRKSSPPVLIINGDKDEAVPVTQALLLDAKMKEVGAPHQLIIKIGIGHEVSASDKAVWDFLDRTLKGSFWNRLLHYVGL